MSNELSIYIGVFSTLLAIVNPLESLPIFLTLLQGQDERAQRKVAFQACLYAAVMMIFFLVFGRVVLTVFGVSLSMVRTVGGIILIRIGFSLFTQPGGDLAKLGEGPNEGNIAFVPLAMPLMFGPGALATMIGYSSMIKVSEFGGGTLAGFCAAIAATMAVTYATLVNGRRILRRVGPLAIDAITRLVGFFIAAMGMGLIFHGLAEAVREFAKGTL
ncbi:MAG TPA: MarC family protein [Desulfuromonadaceae bacterium]